MNDDYRDPVELASSPRRFYLPGFTADQEIGLGDVIKRVTSAVGLRTCEPCQQRAEALNRRFVITGKRE